MEYGDFRKSVLKLNNKRVHKLSYSFGVRDIFRIANKAKWYGNEKPASEHEYYQIIRKMNTLMAQELIEGRDLFFPKKMGSLEIRKYKTYVKFEDGKVKTNRKIDWNATIKLWHEDEDAREEKILVRTENPHVFTIYYNKYPANYNNKKFYQFLPNRELRVAVKHAGTNGDIDAYNLKKNG